MSDWLIISVKLVISSNMKYGQHLPLNYMSFQFSTSSRVITQGILKFFLKQNYWKTIDTKFIWACCKQVNHNINPEVNGDRILCN
jgi:hypothetical protein